MKDVTVRDSTDNVQKEDNYSLPKEEIYEEKSIEDICLSTWREVYRFIYYKVGNKEEAEDITQETYVKAINLLQKEHVHINDYAKYFKTMAINILKDQWRKDKKTNGFVDIEKVESITLVTEDFTKELEQKELVQMAMDSLNEEQKKVIELRILEGYTVAETARLLKKRPVTVRVIQYRALQTMAKTLKEL